MIFSRVRRTATAASLALVAIVGVTLSAQAAVAEEALFAPVVEATPEPALETTTEPTLEPAIEPIQGTAVDVPITSISPDPIYAWSEVVVSGTKTAGTAVISHLFSPTLGESTPMRCEGAGVAAYRGGSEYVFTTGDPGTTWSCTFKLTETVQQIGEEIKFYTGEGQAGETLLPSYNVITTRVTGDPVSDPTLSITPPNTLEINWVSSENGSNYIYSIYNPVTPTLFGASVPIVAGEFVSGPILRIVQDMTPGWWVVDIELRYRAQPVGARTVTVYVPTPPTVSAATAFPTGQVQFSGTGEPGSTVEIVEALTVVPASAPMMALAASAPEPVEASSAFVPAAVPGNLVCGATVGLGGAWSCTSGVLAPGEKQFLARSNAPVTSSLPVAGSYLAGGTFSPVTIVTTVLAPPAPPVVAPRPPVSVPAEPTPPVEVTEEAEPQPEPAPTVDEPVALPAPGGDGDSGEPARDDPATPSALTGSIPTIGELFSNPVALAAGGGFALALLLLVAIPSELLNSTLASGGHRLGRGYLALQGALERFNDRLTGVTRTPLASAGLLVVVLSIIFGFNDPNYGFDAVSVRLTLSMATSIFIVYCLAALLSGAIMKRLWGIRSQLEMLPTALLLAVLGVVIARLINFTPGFLIGLAIGLAIIGTVPAALRAKAILVQFGVTFAVGMLAYIAYSVLRGVPGLLNTVPGVFLDDTLVAIVAESLTGLLIVLLPLAFFNGRELWAQSKLLWVVSFMVVATAFSAIVLPTATQQVGSVVDLVPWLIPVAIYAVVVFGLWGWLSLEERKAQHAAAAEREKDYVA